MKRFRWIILAVAAISIGWLVRTIVAHPSQPMIQGRPLSDWVDKVEADTVDQNKPANEVLYAAGPSIVPHLSRLLRQHEPALLARMPRSWLLPALKARLEHHFRMQANAAFVISVIAYRFPGRSELQQAIPELATALNSRDEQVRYISAQALGAIGTAASNTLPALVIRTTDASSSVRFCAVEAMGRIGIPSSGSLSAVRAALQDAHNDVRIAATQAMTRLERNHR